MVDMLIFLSLVVLWEIYTQIEFRKLYLEILSSLGSYTWKFYRV